MTIASTFALIVAVFVLGITPGPAVFATVARAVASGFQGALAFHVGVMLGDVVLLLLAIFGLAAVAQALGELFIVVKVAGGIYLIWLGWRLWTAEPGVAPSTTPVKPLDREAGRNVLAGLLLTLGNPKAIVFYAAFLPTFIDLARLTAGDVAICLTVVVVVLSIVNLGYAALAARARALLASRRAMRSLNRASGAMMAGVGVAVATR